MGRKNDINFDYNSEVKKCKTIDDVLGKNGLVQRLIKDVLENILEAEMDEHLGRDIYQRQGDSEPGERNYRNGYSQKNTNKFFFWGEKERINFLLLINCISYNSIFSFLCLRKF